MEIPNLNLINTRHVFVPAGWESKIQDGGRQIQFIVVWVYARYIDSALNATLMVYGLMGSQTRPCSVMEINVGDGGQNTNCDTRDDE